MRRERGVEEGGKVILDVEGIVLVVMYWPSELRGMGKWHMWLVKEGGRE